MGNNCCCSRKDPPLPPTTNISLTSENKEDLIISDQTLINGKTWKQLKDTAMRQEFNLSPQFVGT